MAPSGEAVPAPAANYVPLAAHNVAWKEVVDVRPDLYDFSHKFVPDRHRHMNGLLCPLVPLIDMNVGSADTRIAHADQHIIDANRGCRNILKPESALRLALHQCLHLCSPFLS